MNNSDQPGILVRCPSHRARARLFAALNRKPQGWFTFQRDYVYGLYEIEPEELPSARGAGCSRHRLVGNYHHTGLFA